MSYEIAVNFCSYHLSRFILNLPEFSVLNTEILLGLIITCLAIYTGYKVYSVIR